MRDWANDEWDLLNFTYLALFAVQINYPNLGMAPEKHSPIVCQRRTMNHLGYNPDMTAGSQPISLTY